MALPSTFPATDELKHAVGAMRDFDAPWFIAGGWALDLFRGSISRPHADVEIALFREDQHALRRHLAGWEFEKVDGGSRSRWSVDEWLAVPIHELHGSAGPGSWQLEFLLNERAGSQWVYRRNGAVRYPAREVGLRSADGIPFLRPEIVLLYKAKARRPIDEQDFQVVRRALGATERAWLREALEVCHPDHDWLGML
jgi:hypothetical protein